MLWRRTGGRVVECVWLPEALWHALEAEAEEFAPDETGGMLVGYSSDRSLVITRVIPGGPAAIRLASRFEPDGEWQQAELERIYIESGRIETFLGDWHSHPLGVGRPSRRDRRTAARVARSPQARCRTPLTLIAGKTLTDGWTLAPFVYLGWRRFRALTMEAYRS